MRSVKRNYGKALLVKEFLGFTGDNELEKLMIFLEKIKEVQNVRTVDKRGWKDTDIF